MQANELRIGNLINMPFLGDINLTVIGLAVKDDMELYIQSKSNSGTTFFEKPDKYKPIPISEELIFKFGFKRKEYISNFYTLLDYDILYVENEWRFIICNYMGNPPSVKIKYVHQLQNLYFAITGEELTIKK